MNSATIRQLSHHIYHPNPALKNVIRELSTTVEEMQVYIGLNDAETKTQKFDTDRYISMLKEVCRDFEVPFSFNVVEGGYLHDDGEYTEEKSIVLTFIDLEKEKVEAIAKKLCVLFHQESVLVTLDRVFVRSIRVSK